MCCNAGGSWDSEGYVEVSKSVFLGNKASHGGAIINYGKLLTESSLYCGNVAMFHGGALYSSVSQLFDIKNCSFVDNKASLGSFLAASRQLHVPVIIDNCIVTNGDQEIYNNQANITINYTAISDDSSSVYDSNYITRGEGNLDVDPCFVDPGYWDANGTSNDPNDDFYVAGDYHLKSQAGHWTSASSVESDPNSETWIQGEVTSPCIDAGDPNSPIMYEPFPNGGRINMGAYGGTVEASKSYFGEPVCETIIAGDINGDCKVNFLDLAILASHWLE
jgi:hypothetical protein